jgi:hypothetical protein
MDRRVRSVLTFVVRDTLSSSSLDDCSRLLVLLARARVEPRRTMVPVLHLFGA